MPSATLKLFLVYGDPKRLRTAELSNWIGKAVAGPRSEFEKLLERSECESTGIYFLGSSGNLVRDFGAEGELAAAEQNTVPVVFKVSKTSCRRFD